MQSIEYLFEGSKTYLYGVRIIVNHYLANLVD